MEVKKNGPNQGAQPTSEDLKIRVLEAKKLLPGSGVTSLFFHYFKDEDNDAKARAKLNNILQARITDEATTVKLEKLVELLKNEN